MVTEAFELTSSALGCLGKLMSKFAFMIADISYIYACRKLQGNKRIYYFILRVKGKLIPSEGWVERMICGQQSSC